MVDNFPFELIKEINLVRTDPSEYAKKLLSYKNNFRDKVLRIPGQTAILTNEGFSAFQEASDFLSETKPMNTIVLNPYLTRIAEDAYSLSKDSDADSVVDLDSIIAKHGQIVGIFSEAIDFGSSTPEMVVINLLVDDGDPNRGNRANILNPKFKLCGIAKGTHKTYKNMTVITYARHFFSKGEDIGILSDENYEDSQTEKTKASVSTFKPEIISTQVPQTQKSGVVNIIDPDCEDMDLPDGVVKIDRTEKIVDEGGRKKKIIKIVKTMEDGSKETEITKINL